jgi:hypothetical protein
VIECLYSESGERKVRVFLSKPNTVFIYLYFWSERYNRRRGREGKERGGGILYIRERRKRRGNRSVSGRKETHVWFVL